MHRRLARHCCIVVLTMLICPPASALEKVMDPVVSAFSPREACQNSSDTMCLNSERFRVQVLWRDSQGQTGKGTVVDGGSDDSGLFWFFSSDNWELLVKVLDGCSVNEHYWVFAAATTDVAYTLTVTDTESNAIAQYANPLGTAADAITDAAAFETCP